MSRRRKSFAEKRRARQAMKRDRLDKLESRNTITEPVSLLGLATGSVRGMVQFGLMQADGGGLRAMARLAQQAQQGPTPISKALSAADNSVPMRIVLPDTLSVLGLGAGGSASSSSAGALAGTGAVGTIVSRNSSATALKDGANAPSKKGLVHTDTSPAFELVTLDFNDGSVMVPGHDQLATPGGSVNLMAQVRDTATGTYTYSWNTTGFSDATSISGSSTAPACSWPVRLRSPDTTLQSSSTPARSKPRSTCRATIRIFQGSRSIMIRWRRMPSRSSSPSTR